MVERDQTAKALFGSVVMLLAVFAGATSLVGTAAAQPTEIDSCTEINESGTYVLTQDVENASGTCIEVNASDVVLDGNGQTIDGVQNNSSLAAFRNASLAPSVVFSDNETVQNETLVSEVLANYPTPSNPRWANIGIAANTSGTFENVTVQNVTVTGFAFGVYYENVSNGTVDNVTAEANGDGVDVFNSTQVTINDTRLTDNQWGAFAVNVTESTVTNVTGDGNELAGIEAFLSPGVSIVNITASDSPLSVALVLSNDSRLANSTITDSAFTGVGLLGSENVTVDNTTVANTTGVVPEYLAAFLAPFAAPAGINLDAVSDSEFRNVSLVNNTEWDYYSTGNSTDNVGETVRINSTVVGFNASGVSMTAANAVTANDSDAVTVGSGVTVANTTANATLSLNATWDLAGNETVVDGGANETTGDGTTAAEVSS